MHWAIMLRQSNIIIDYGVQSHTNIYCFCTIRIYIYIISITYSQTVTTFIDSTLYFGLKYPGNDSFFYSCTVHLDTTKVF